MSWYEARDEAGREWAREHANEMFDDGDFDEEIVDRILEGDFDDAVQERFHKIEDDYEKELNAYMEEQHEAIQDRILAQQELEDYAKDNEPEDYYTNEYDEY